MQRWITRTDSRGVIRHALGDSGDGVSYPPALSHAEGGGPTRDRHHPTSRLTQEPQREVGQ